MPGDHKSPPAMPGDHKSPPAMPGTAVAWAGPGIGRMRHRQNLPASPVSAVSRRAPAPPGTAPP